MQILAERRGCYHLGGMPLFQTVTKIVLILFFFFKRATFGFFKMEKRKISGILLLLLKSCGKKVLEGKKVLSKVDHYFSLLTTNTI